MRLQTTCPHCFKNLRITNHWLLENGDELRFLKCGHILLHGIQKLFEHETDINSVSGHDAAWTYQIEGIDFVNKTNGNALIADEMGLGKTVQDLLYHKAGMDKLTPNLKIVKSATLWQWFQQYKKWCSNKLTGIFMIKDAKSFIPPGFDTYLVSMDTFSRMVKAERNPYGKIINVTINSQLDGIKFKSVTVDECQSFKDPSSNRTTALVAFLQHQQIPYKLFLSGTPIKNRADEYFTTLNLLDPESFPSIEEFRRNWLVMDQKGKWSSVNPFRLEQFRELIANYVIRREKADVLKSLPEFRRTFETISVEDDKIKKVYNMELDKLRAKSDSKENLTWMDVSDSLMTLRRIMGLAKVDFAVEYIDTFLDTVEDEKIAIGIHHQAVRDLLFFKLKERGFNVLKLSGEDNSDKKNEIKNEFTKPENRILIINMLAGGVGMDGLQVCNNVICLERQWNSVDEEQFEARFHRAGQTKPVLCEYMIAKGTIDDYFSKLVEAKRLIVDQAVGNAWAASDPAMLRELIEMTISSRL
jgi:SNF2 family DNA or RNA helicase